MDCRKEILRAFKTKTNGSGATLPENLNFRQNRENEVTIEFQDVTQMGITINGKYKNMQHDEACFEGWAAAIYTYYSEKNGKICLKASDEIEKEDYSFEKIHSNRHFARFLYRALRFSQQYEWFDLDTNLHQAVNDFNIFITKHILSNKFFSTKSDSKSRLESQVEGEFASGGKRTDELKKKLKEKGIDCKQINRQLPTGLSLYEADFFPSGTSAIDLWTISQKTFCPIELKSKRHKLEQITEIFFYSNFSYDMFIRGNNENIKTGFKLNTNPTNAELYKVLIFPEQKMENVKGFLLLDKESMHPLVTNEVISVLNKSNNPNITYDIIEYELP